MVVSKGVRLAVWMGGGLAVLMDMNLAVKWAGRLVGEKGGSLVVLMDCWLVVSKGESLVWSLAAL